MDEKELEFKSLVKNTIAQYSEVTGNYLLGQDSELLSNMIFANVKFALEKKEKAQ